MTHTIEEATNAQAGDAGTTPERKTRRRRWPWLVGIGLGAAALIAIVAAASSSGDGPVADVSLNTATVERMNLVSIESLDGTLGYGAADPISYQTSAEGVVTVDSLTTGFVTNVVDAGEVLETGSVLYEVNASPIVVLNGDLPPYRTFDSRMADGPDVEQLELALVELGMDPDGDITVDEDFTSATADAIERLQESIGAEETGRLLLGDVTFVPTPSFVAEVLVGVGDQVQPGVPVAATSKAITGTATWIVEEGSTVVSGQPLIAVDGEPVLLLTGDIPMYRALSQGTEGDDVEQLQQSLLALGFGNQAGLEVSGSFDDATLASVVEWQSASGASPDGVVNIGDVIVQPGTIRVNETLASVGDPIGQGTPLMTTSIDATFVSVQLSTDDQDLVAVGDAVIVELPSGTAESAVVTEIGSVVLANQQGGTYFEMTVTLDDADAAKGLDQAPVDVEVVGDSASNVLVVPVTSLLALAEGGYAVEVVASDGSVVLVGVEPGLFADGLVEVTSDTLDAGMRVVIP